MWKAVGYLLLWGAGSTAAVAVAWTGVSAVDDGIAPPANEVRDTETALAPSDRARSDDDDSSNSSTSITVITSSGSSSATDRSTSPTVDGAASSDASRATSSTRSSTTRATASTSSTGRSGTASTGSTATSSSTTTRSTATPSTVGPTTSRSTTSRPTTAPTAASTPTTSTPTTTAAPAQTKTYQLVGGTTSISFSASEVRVLWATPNPGFEVRIDNGSSNVRVEFRSDDHDTRIDAWWQGGPQQEIREQAD